MVKMFDWLRKSKAAAPRAAELPAGIRVYAVGDVHGRLDLLEKLLDSVIKHAGHHPIDHNILVLLGDYVDRGMKSREVVELLSRLELPGFEIVALMGNHERSMLDFLDDPATGPGWFEYGGVATAMSYGVRAQGGGDWTEARLKKVQAELSGALPRQHYEFLAGLRLFFTVGDYAFVHAGVRPGIPLEQQRVEDLLWIRDPFLTSREDHGGVIVHGHTVCEKPQVLANRIGIDTGAYASNILTCLVLEGSQRWLMYGKG